MWKGREKKWRESKGESKRKRKREGEGEKEREIGRRRGREGVRERGEKRVGLKDGKKKMALTNKKRQTGNR